MRSYFLAAFGLFMLLMGGIGLFVPIWPTTPFVLVAASCFASHPRLRGWLSKSKFFNEYIQNYQKRMGLSKRVVIISLSYLWGMLTLSVFLVNKTAITILLICIGCAVTAHILYIANPKDEGKNDRDSSE